MFLLKKCIIEGLEMGILTEGIQRSYLACPNAEQGLLKVSPKNHLNTFTRSVISVTTITVQGGSAEAYYNIHQIHNSKGFKLHSAE